MEIYINKSGIYFIIHIYNHAIYVCICNHTYISTHLYMCVCVCVCVCVYTLEKEIATHSSTLA